VKLGLTPRRRGLTPRRRMDPIASTAFSSRSFITSPLVTFVSKTLTGPPTARRARRRVFGDSKSSWGALKTSVSTKTYGVTALSGTPRPLGVHGRVPVSLPCGASRPY